MSLLGLRDRALELAAAYVGLREAGGNNRGPLFDEWNQKLGLPLGSPCCVSAIVVGCYDRAALELKVKNPLPRTGRASKLWTRAPAWMKTLVPCRGAIFVHIRDDEADEEIDSPDEVDATGHVGLVSDLVHVERRNLTIEFNTNRKGSREGDGCYRSGRTWDYVNGGYIDVGREPPWGLT